MPFLRAEFVVRVVAGSVLMSVLLAVIQPRVDRYRRRAMGPAAWPVSAAAGSGRVSCAARPAAGASPLGSSAAPWTSSPIWQVGRRVRARCSDSACRLTAGCSARQAPAGSPRASRCSLTTWTPSAPVSTDDQHSRWWIARLRMSRCHRSCRSAPVCPGLPGLPGQLGPVRGVAPGNHTQTYARSGSEVVIDRDAAHALRQQRQPVEGLAQ